MSTASSIRLEDLRHLSDEVRLLVRAGLPLEQHLADAGRGHSARLQSVTEMIDGRLRSGESLEHVIRDETGGPSRMLASAVAAGLRTGRLGDTIEMMGDFASDLVDLRRHILRAISYPLTIVAVAWLLFVLVLQHSLEKVYVTSQQLDLTFHPVLEQGLQWNRDYPQWVWAVPGILFLLIGVWVISGRAESMAFRGPERILLWLPGVSMLVRDLRFYTLTRMLTLLIDQQLPLPDALILSGAISGSRDLDRVSQQVALQLRSGNPAGSVSTRRWTRRQLPPLLQVCLQQAGTEADRLSLRLKGITQHYQERLRFNAEWLSTILPLIVFLVVAVGAVTLYTVAVFWPILEVYRGLSTSYR